MSSENETLNLQHETTRNAIDQVNHDFWNDRRVLITGITGFVASWMSEILSSQKCNAKVFGLVRRQSNPNLVNINHIMSRSGFNLIKGDLNDLSSLVTAIRESEADIIFHLGAQSFVPHSFASPTDTYETNVIGTLNMLEALRIVNHDAVMHFAGSSEEYGLVITGEDHYREMTKKYGIILPAPNLDTDGRAISEIPIKETNPLRTVGTSPYGSSKRQAEDACRTYVSCYGSKVYLTRGFNHTGPRRGNEFVSCEITRQISEGIKYDKKHVVLGNLDAIRDFNDVRDVVLGYLLCIERGTPGDVYNLASGTGVRIGDLLNLALDVARSKYNLGEMSYQRDPLRLRPTDLPVLVGDASKAKKELGWNPKISLDRTLREMMEFHLSRL